MTRAVVPLPVDLANVPALNQGSLQREADEQSDHPTSMMDSSVRASSTSSCSIRSRSQRSRSPAHRWPALDANLQLPLRSGTTISTGDVGLPQLGAQLEPVDETEMHAQFRCAIRKQVYLVIVLCLCVQSAALFLLWSAPSKLAMVNIESLVLQMVLGAQPFLLSMAAAHYRYGWQVAAEMLFSLIFGTYALVAAVWLVLPFTSILSNAELTSLLYTSEEYPLVVGSYWLVSGVICGAMPLAPRQRAAVSISFNATVAFVYATGYFRLGDAVVLRVYLSYPMPYATGVALWWALEHYIMWPIWKHGHRAELMLAEVEASRRVVLAGRMRKAAARAKDTAAGIEAAIEQHEEAVSFPNKRLLRSSSAHH